MADEKKRLDLDGLDTFASELSQKLDATYEKKGEGGSGYTKAETDALLLGKVSKVDGKGLSTNDYSDADKSSVGEISGLKENLTELEQKAITSTEEESYEPTVPRDADTLGGRITANDIDELGEWINIGNVSYTQKGTYELPSIDRYRTLMIIPCAMQNPSFHMNTPFIIPTSIYREKNSFEFNSWSTGQWRFFTRIKYVSDTSFEVTEYEVGNYNGIRLFFLGMK